MGRCRSQGAQQWSSQLSWRRAGSCGRTGPCCWRSGLCSLHGGLGCPGKNTVPMRYQQSTLMPQSCHPTSLQPLQASMALLSHTVAPAFAPTLWLSFVGKQHLQIWSSDLRRAATSSGVSQHCTWGPLICLSPPVPLATQPPASHTVLYQHHHSHCLPQTKHH